MKLIYCLTVLILIYSCEDLSKQEEISTKCDCDSTFNESFLNKKEYTCYFDDKKTVVVKNDNGDSVEIKKYIFNGEKYQKFEYLFIINNKIDTLNSSFLNIKINNNIVSLNVVSQLSYSSVRLFFDGDTMNFDINEVKIDLEKLKKIKKVQFVHNEVINNDSIKSKDYIFTYYYSFNDIAGKRTLINQYSFMKSCKIIE